MKEDEENDDTPAALFLLDGPSKAFLLHSVLMKAVSGSNGNPKRIKLVIRREECLDDVVSRLIEEGFLPIGGNSGKPAAVLNPFFTSLQGKVEEGQGHGPRKEVFALISNQLSAVFGKSHSGHTLGLILSGKKGSKSLACQVKADSTLIEAGFRIVFSAEGQFFCPLIYQHHLNPSVP